LLLACNQTPQISDNKAEVTFHIFLVQPVV